MISTPRTIEAHNNYVKMINDILDKHQVSCDTYKYSVAALERVDTKSEFVAVYSQIQKDGINTIELEDFISCDRDGVCTSDEECSLADLICAMYEAVTGYAEVNLDELDEELLDR